MLFSYNVQAFREKVQFIVHEGISGAAGIIKAVNDAEAKQQQLEDQKRHNAAMEISVTGKGLRKRYLRGRGVF